MHSYIRNVPIWEILEQFEHNHGCVLQNIHYTEINRIPETVSFLKKAHIIKRNPLLISDLNCGTVIVFDDLDNIRFWRAVTHFCNMTNTVIEPLNLFLNNNRKVIELLKNQNDAAKEGKDESGEGK